MLLFLSFFLEATNVMARMGMDAPRLWGSYRSYPLDDPGGHVGSCSGASGSSQKIMGRGFWGDVFSNTFLCGLQLDRLGCLELLFNRKVLRLAEIAHLC